LTLVTVSLPTQHQPKGSNAVAEFTLDYPASEDSTRNIAPALRRLMLRVGIWMSENPDTPVGDIVYERNITRRQHVIYLLVLPPQPEGPE
jgi:hypothetical protein